MDNYSDEFLEAIEAYLFGEDEKAFLLMEHCAQDGDVRACVQLMNWCRDEGFEDYSEENADFWLSRIRQMAAGGNADAKRQLGRLQKGA